MQDSPKRLNGQFWHQDVQRPPGLAQKMPQKMP
jgi:hypothetical protein